MFCSGQTGALLLFRSTQEISQKTKTKTAAFNSQVVKGGLNARSQLPYLAESGKGELPPTPQVESPDQSLGSGSQLPPGFLPVFLVCPSLSGVVAISPHRDPIKAFFLSPPFPG